MQEQTDQNTTFDRFGGEKVIKVKHMAEARKIGKDSYSLIHYEQLKKDATHKEQVEALKADIKWQEDHHNEITRRIDALIDSIEEE